MWHLINKLNGVGATDLVLGDDVICFLMCGEQKGGDGWGHTLRDVFDLCVCDNTGAAGHG